MDTAANEANCDEAGLAIVGPVVLNDQSGLEFECARTLERNAVLRFVGLSLCLIPFELYVSAPPDN